MIVMGHIIGPSGIHGWIKINPYTEYTDGLMDYPCWWLSRGTDGWQEVHVTAGRTSGNVLTAKLKEYTDRTQAEQLKGMLIAIPRELLPQLPKNGDDGYYWTDLIGASIVNLTGTALGTVTGLLETGANDVLRIQCTDKAENREILIPFVEQFIVKVDLTQSQITVDWEMDY